MVIQDDLTVNFFTGQIILAKGDVLQMCLDIYLLGVEFPWKASLWVGHKLIYSQTGCMYFGLLERSTSYAGLTYLFSNNE